MCAQRRQRSAWASAQTDQSFRCPHDNAFRSIGSLALIRLGGFPGWSETSLDAHVIVLILLCWASYYIWSIKAASWQNQPCGCAPSEDSDQPGHPPSLIKVFCVRMKKAWVLSYPLSTQRRLWSDWAWSEYSLGAHVSMLVLSRGGSYEPRHEKTCFRGLRPGKSQTDLLQFLASVLEFWIWQL